MKNKNRSISVITQEIISDMQREQREAQEAGKKAKNWRQKYYYFVEGYMNAMLSLDSIDDNYIMDSGRSVVAYALGNLTTWKGEKAREIKKELNKLLKS